MTDSPYGLPPEEAIRYFTAKGMKPTFRWQEMIGEEHAHAFTVAKATQADILEDIRQAMTEAIEKGTTLDDFRKNLTPLLQSKGWWGKQTVRDPKGNEVLAQLGSPRRLRTIYETNLRMAHSAGRWEKIQRTKDRRPYLRYVAVLDGNTRRAHEAWHGIILHADDAWWNTHYPPNGWGCRCKVQQLSERDIVRFRTEALARGANERDPERRREAYSLASSLKVRPKAPRVHQITVDLRGAVFLAPQGVDPSFAYNVGKARAEIVKLKGDEPAPWHRRRTYSRQPVRRGKDTRAFDEFESDTADRLAGEGNDVTSAEKKSKEQGRRQYDALVNGMPVELKAPRTESGDFIGLLQDAAGSPKKAAQARAVVVDVRGTRMTKEQAETQIRVAREHLMNRLSHVRIIGDKFDLTFTAKDLSS